MSKFKVGDKVVGSECACEDIRGKRGVVVAIDQVNRPQAIVHFANTCIGSGSFSTVGVGDLALTRARTIEDIVQEAASTERPVNSCQGCGYITACVDDYGIRSAGCPAFFAAVVEAAIEASRDV